MNVYQTISRRFSTAAKLFLLAVILTATVQAQSSGVDLSFNAIVSKDTDNNGSPIRANFTLQPDGRILTYGSFQVVNGVVKNNIARFNPDGSLDTTFDCPACDFNISSAIVQPDGKIIVAGSIYAADNGAAAARLKRLNTDGSLDTSFAPTSPFNDPLTFPQIYSATVWAVQPDGKILVVLSSSNSGFSSDNLYRLNPNGTFDNTFTAITVGSGRLVRTSPVKISLLGDGKILVATITSNGSSSGANLSRYNADGSPDSTFESPILTGDPDVINNYSAFNDFDVQPDGKIVIGGLFTAVNSISRRNIARLMPAGNLDLSFVPADVFMRAEPVNQVKVLSNGQILFSTGTGLTTAFPPPSSGNRFFRFNADGSVDNTFASPTNLTLIVKWQVDASDRILVYGGFLENGATVLKFARLNTDGSVSSSFVVNYGIGGSVSSLAIQTDGKVIIGGDFTRVGGVLRPNFARLNADGTLDTSFNTGTGFNNTVQKIVIQSDGKILVGGNFRTYNGIAQVALVRLNSDGSLDAAFNPGITDATIYSIALQSDGKILIGGAFTSIGGQTRNAIARLNADGSLDASFNPLLGNPSQYSVATVRRILVQSDGKIMVGGSFTGVNGFARQGLVRLNADGTVDATFNAGNISASQIEQQADGKYLVYTNALVRLNNDGTTDATFQSPTLNGYIYAILIQPDGTIIIGGDFTTVNGVQRKRIARLRADGTVDRSFLPTGANNTIRAIAGQADGKLTVGGDFTSIENVTRLAVARLNVSPVRAPFTPFDFDGDGRADLAVFRPSNGFWYQLRSQNSSFYALQFGQSNDQLAPADYDGDGRTDIAVFRDQVPGAGNFAYFYITDSSDNSFVPVHFGATGDVPVSGDWDGDGKADLAVYRDGSLTGGQSYFFYRPSSQPGVDYRAIAWGASGDKPVMGDFDGDGKLDAAVFRPSTGTWYILKSSNNQVIEVQFGVSTDIPTPADYNGDGVTDLAVFRPSNGTWYIARTTINPSQNFDARQFGAQGDLPVPADFDGDGKADLAVYRPSNGAWYLLGTTQGFTAVQFGISEDRPVPNAFIR